jgi:hypothetical protein
MHRVQIGLGQRQVGLHHLQCRMPQRHARESGARCLELECVSAVAAPVALEVHGKRVAEPVWVTVLYAGLRP